MGLIAIGKNSCTENDLTRMAVSNCSAADVSKVH